MSERTFTYVWSDAKRLTVLHALGLMFAKLKTAPPAVSETVLELIGNLTTTPGKDAPIGPGTEAARAVLSPPVKPAPAAAREPMDYFARDRRGNVPMQPPTGAELQVTPIMNAAEKTSSKGKYLQITFAGRGKANCFDEQLWPFLKRAQGHDLPLWILESGNYLNIVGVRA